MFLNSIGLAGQYRDYDRGALSLSQDTVTHFKFGYP